MPLWSRILRALGYLLASLFLLSLAFLAFEVLSGLSGFVVGAVFMMVAVLAFARGLSLLAPETNQGTPEAGARHLGDAEEGGPRDAFVAARDEVWEKAQAVLAEHREALADLPTGDRRMELLLVWRRAIDTHAHAYADLVAGHEEGSRVAELHGEAVMTAWALGYAAGRDWITREETKLDVGTLGRLLREGLRARGLPIDDLGLDLPFIVDRALAEIAELGREDGTADADN